MPNHMQKISFIPKFILINFIIKFILACCFESLWARLTTTTWNNWINLIRLLIPYQTQKTNFITQFILEIKLTNYLSSLWACAGMPDHIHLKKPTNICCFYGPLVTSKNLLYTSSFLWDIIVFKESCILLGMRFLEHNSRTKFFPSMLFL